jgi:hypothetical protein
MISASSFCFILKEFSKKMDQHGIIEILDQAKARDPECHETIVDVEILSLLRTDPEVYDDKKSRST